MFRALSRAFVLPAMLAAGAFLAPSLLAQESAAREYQVKAAFLLRFIQFTEWPPLPGDGSICIAVLGDDPFGASLDEAVRNESVRGQKLVVRRIQRLDEAKSCHVVFVSRSERGRSSEIAAESGKAPSLTVGDFEGFASQGGVIDFIPEGAKLRFEINPHAAKRKGLRISSELLRLGKLVGSEKSEGSR